MKSSIIPAVMESRSSSQPRQPMGYRMAQALMLRHLRKISDGQLIIRDDEQQWTFGEPSARLPLPITITVTDPSAWYDIAFGGASGAGEAYIKGSWKADDLTGVIRIFMRNKDALYGFNRSLKLLRQPARLLKYWMDRNTPAGSKRNISAHYDIGNDFFMLFLDPTMMYSSAFYPNSAASLEEAATYKLERICQKLGLEPGMHLLEIGTGWGGMAIHAAKNFGCKVTTTTISQEQYAYAKEKVAAEGLNEQIEVLCRDYRELEGKYDRIVSIEMIEAVGHQFMGKYFKQCSSLLKDDGQMLIQAITMNDQHYKQALNEVDFIKKYIFPGGFLPSVTAIGDSLTKATDMRISHLEDIGLHYAKTLHDWRERFLQQLDAVKAQGYSDAFIRLWDYYLCYSEGGFEERYIGTVQLLMSKPDARPADVRY